MRCDAVNGVAFFIIILLLFYYYFILFYFTSFTLLYLLSFYVFSEAEGEWNGSNAATERSALPLLYIGPCAAKI